MAKRRKIKAMTRFKASVRKQKRAEGKLRAPRMTKSVMESILRDAERKVKDLDVKYVKMTANYRNLHEQFENLSNPNWKMGNGLLIRVTQMEEGHLRNSISYCTRRLLGNHPGLGDTVYLDNMTRYIEGLANLLREAKRRNIRV